MKSKGIDWLENKVPGFAKLSTEEKVEIQDFAMLWSFFESRKLKMNASIPEIRNYVKKLSQSGVFENFNFTSCLNHFKSRYFLDGQYTRHYFDLRLEKSGSPDEVEQMLVNLEASQETKLIACLAIIFRYRNNLFHGEKWQYYIQDQFKNFAHSNELLISLMDFDDF